MLAKHGALLRVYSSSLGKEKQLRLTNKVKSIVNIQQLQSMLQSVKFVQLLHQNRIDTCAIPDGGDVKL